MTAPLRQIEPHFIRSLVLKGVPEEEYHAYRSVLVELVEFTRKPPTGWTDADLKAFYAQRAVGKAPERANIYATSLAAIATILRIDRGSDSASGFGKREVTAHGTGTVPSRSVTGREAAPVTSAGPTTDRSSGEQPRVDTTETHPPTKRAQHSTRPPTPADDARGDTAANFGGRSTTAAAPGWSLPDALSINTDFDGWVELVWRDTVSGEPIYAALNWCLSELVRREDRGLRIDMRDATHLDIADAAWLESWLEQAVVRGLRCLAILDSRNVTVARRIGRLVRSARRRRSLCGGDGGLRIERFRAPHRAEMWLAAGGEL